MPSTSKSKERNPKKLNVAPEPQKRSGMKKQERNWLELPYDVIANILYRVGVIDILKNAQKVCTTWRQICKDPAMWRVIYMDNLFTAQNTRTRLQKMCKHAVDRSHGQLVDLTIVEFADDQLLQYVADRSSQLRRLAVAWCGDHTYESWTQVLKKFPLLEELSLCSTAFPDEGIETIAQYCPMLRTLKLSEDSSYWEGGDGDNNGKAIAIGKNLHELRHLELIGNDMSNVGLQAILDGCSHLESLDLRECYSIDLEGDLGKKRLENIKCVRLPNRVW